MSIVNRPPPTTSDRRTGHIVAVAVQLAAAVVVGRAAWWALHNFFSWHWGREAIWPWRHLVCYTLPAAFLGVEAVLLLLRVRGKAFAFAPLAHVVAIGCAWWMMHWADAVRGVIPHMNSFDRQYYFGNTIWLWLLEPATIVLAVLAALDLQKIRSSV